MTFFPWLEVLYGEMISFIARGREIIKVKFTKDFTSNWPYGLERKVLLFSFVFQSRCAGSVDFWLWRHCHPSLGDSNHNCYTVSCAIFVHVRVIKLSTVTVFLSQFPLFIESGCQCELWCQSAVCSLISLDAPLPNCNPSKFRAQGLLCAQGSNDFWYKCNCMIHMEVIVFVCLLAYLNTDNADLQSNIFASLHKLMQLMFCI